MSFFFHKPRQMLRAGKALLESSLTSAVSYKVSKSIPIGGLQFPILGVPPHNSDFFYATQPSPNPFSSAATLRCMAHDHGGVSEEWLGSDCKVNTHSLTDTTHTKNPHEQ